MYKCDECGLVFSEPKRYSEDRAPYGAEFDPRFYETLYGCPSCLGTYSEAMQCVRCEDEYIKVRSTYPFCDSCKEDLLKTYKKLMTENFREDEYDYIYEATDGFDYKDLIEKKEGNTNENN